MTCKNNKRKIPNQRHRYEKKRALVRIYNKYQTKILC